MLLYRVQKWPTGGRKQRDKNKRQLNRSLVAHFLFNLRASGSSLLLLLLQAETGIKKIDAPRNPEEIIHPRQQLGLFKRYRSVYINPRRYAGVQTIYLDKREEKTRKGPLRKLHCSSRYICTETERSGSSSPSLCREIKVLTWLEEENAGQKRIITRFSYILCSGWYMPSPCSIQVSVRRRNQTRQKIFARGSTAT